MFKKLRIYLWGFLNVCAMFRSGITFKVISAAFMAGARPTLLMIDWYLQAMFIKVSYLDYIIASIAYLITF